jgi:protein-disulfide isomerase
MSEEKSITIKKSDLWKYSTFLLIGIILIGVVFVFTGNGATSGSGSGTTTGTDPNQPPAQVRASVDDDAVLGDPNAEVTIIEFSDYQCPFCRKFWVETLPSIKEQYIDTGKVKFVYRDFPLVSLHPQADKFAEAVECVRDQGGDTAYFEMHDKMFEEQNILDGGDRLNGPVKGTAQFTLDDVKGWANELGYDIGDCVDSGKFKSEVQKDVADAQSLGGQGTPFFVIMGSDGEGTPLSGAYPFSSFQQVIEAELA